MSIMYAGRDRAVGNMDADRHHEIVDAIDEGDPNNAELAVRTHMTWAVGNLVA